MIGRPFDISVFGPNSRDLKDFVKGVPIVKVILT